MPFQIGDKYYHDDIESGEIVEISKQAYEDMIQWRNRIEQMVNPELKRKGTIIIASTPANIDNNDYKDLWNDIK